MSDTSGFFLTDGPDESSVSSSDLELFHSSENGFNVLYRGCRNGRFFIFKALKPEFAGNYLYEELLKKEFDIGFSITHHGICQYYAMLTLLDIGSCIVMEWVDGRSLKTLIESGEIDNNLAVKIIEELCDALDYMHHKQIIHRDLKPENILITHNGRNVRIIDFGLSDADSYNAFKAPAGTRKYASPELLAGEFIDNRSDIYSLGVIINEISHRYRGVAARCIRRDRNRRYPNAMDVKKGIRLYSRRRALRHFMMLSVVLLAAFGLYWLKESEPSVATDPIPDAVLPDTLQTPSEVSLPLPQPSSDQPRQKEKAAESIDPATLDNLFEEASEIIL